MPDLTLESICHFQCILTRDLKKSKETEENNTVGKTGDLFKKMRNAKGTFHAKTGTMKDRNGMDLLQNCNRSRDTKKRWQ